MEETMKNLYPTYRGKTDDGQIIMEMVDRYGRSWGTGVGSDRVQAQYAARHAMPPKGIIKKVLHYGAEHPMRAAVLTGLAVAAYSMVRYRDQLKSGQISFGGAVVAVAALSLVAYFGIKIVNRLTRNMD